MSWSVLPWDLTSFVGREKERALLVGLGADESYVPKLISISGIAGVGKTRLVRVACAEMAGKFPGGLSYCELGERPEAPGEVLARVLGRPPHSAGDNSVETVASALMRRERSLLVFDHADGYEQELVAALPSWLGAGAHVFIITSRNPLALRGARRITLGPLRPEESLALLKDRIEEFGAAALSSADDCRTVLDHLGGSPLAIELVAGALCTRSAPQVEEALGRGEAILHTSAMDVPERHRSLERALADTWNALGVRERSCLALACMFEERFSASDFAAASEVLATLVRSDHAPHQLESLVARGLVAHGSEGFEILACLRRYVRDQIDDTTDSALIVAHAQVVTDLAASGDLRGHELVRVGQQIARTATDSQSAIRATRMLIASAGYLESRGPVRLRSQMLELAEQLAKDFDVFDMRDEVRLEMARMARAGGDYQGARGLLTQITPAGRATWAWRYHLTDAMVTLEAGDPLAAKHALDCALRAASSDLQRAHVLASRFAYGLVRAEPGNEEEGLEAWMLFDREEELTLANRVLVNLALSALHRGDRGLAGRRIARALRAAHDTGDLVVEAGCLLFRGLAEIDAGDFALAVQSLADSEHIALDLGRRNLWSDAAGYGAIASILDGSEQGHTQLAWHVSELELRGMSGSGALFTAVLARLGKGKAAPGFGAQVQRPLIAAAIEVLNGSDTQLYGVQARIANRIGLLVENRRGCKAPTEVVRVAKDGTRFVRGDNEVDLHRRGPLRNILAALLQERLTSRAQLTPDILVSAGWPGQRIQPEAAKTRLYNAIGTLRSLGLRGVIATTADGYCLAQEIAVEAIEIN